MKTRTSILGILATIAGILIIIGAAGMLLVAMQDRSLRGDNIALGTVGIQCMGGIVVGIAVLGLGQVCSMLASMEGALIFLAQAKQREEFAAAEADRRAHPERISAAAPPPGPSYVV